MILDSKFIAKLIPIIPLRSCGEIYKKSCGSGAKIFQVDNDMTSLRRVPWHHNIQQVALLEYASLKQTCPEGIYLSLKPGASPQWSGVLFVRKGPYAPAILRFQVSFPPDYPILPPAITFISDIFHPLVAPLTTYTYTTGSSGSETVSATDEERLAPGGFSLRHGFPHWYNRSQRSAKSSATTSRNTSDVHANVANQREDLYKPPPPENESSGRSSPGSESFRMGSAQARAENPIQTSRLIKMTEVLEYIKCAFDDETALDTLPLEAAGNSGAWKAWRAYRRSNETDSKLVESAPSLRRQDEWSWEGVWEERVQKGIDASIAEPTLYGGTVGADDLIRFVDVGDNVIEAVKAKMVSSMGGS